MVINGKLISFLLLYTARVGEKKLKVRVEGVFSSPAPPPPPPPSKMDSGAMLLINQEANICSGEKNVCVKFKYLSRSLRPNTWT